jgi:hypothetical protein
MIQKLLLLTGLGLLLTAQLSAQRPRSRAHERPQEREREREEPEAENKGNAFLAHLSFAGHLPAADMAKRFGPDLSFGTGVDFITEHNLIIGAEFDYFFGPKVKEDPLENLRTPEGDIIGNDQAIADVVLRERGFYVGGRIGKLFTFNEKNRSGIRATIGAGMMQHWIRILDNTSSVPEITGNYKYGYDRLTGGLGLNQFVGWQHLGRNKRENWTIGLEFNEGFTKGLRSWDFSLGRPYQDKRVDLRIGLRIGWTLPFYIGHADKIYY